MGGTVLLPPPRDAAQMTEATARVRALLPTGTRLGERAFLARHRVIVLVIALHLPLLAGVGLMRGLPPGPLGPALLALLGLAVLAAAPIGRLGRMLAATLALATSSTLLVHATGGLPEAHLHHFLAVGLVALYQDWRPYLAALAGVVIHHVLLWAVAAQLMAGQVPAVADPWRWAVLHTGFVLAAGMTHLALWKVAETEQARSRALWQELHDGERGLAERLDAVEAVKSELLSVVAHEFRTPLTSIIGFSHTLMARADQLDPSTVRLCVRSIDQQSRRLARLVHNVLAASGDVASDPTASTDLAVAARKVVRDIGDACDEVPAVRVEGLPALRAAIDTAAAHRILLNLVDNALKFSVDGGEVVLRLTSVGGRAVMEVSNDAPPIATSHLERIFEPFLQGDSSDSRAAEGIGLGLHVVRRLLEANDGAVEVHHREGRVVFTATLPLTRRVGRSIDLRHDLALAHRER